MRRISIRETNCVIWWIDFNPVNSAIQLLNNRGQKECHGNQDSCSFEWGCSLVNPSLHFAELFVSMMTMAQRTWTLRSLKKVLKIMDLICQMRYGLRYHITLSLPFDAKSNSADTVQKNPSKTVLSQMIKTVSIRKLNDFNFQWTRLSFQNISSHIAFLFTLFKGYRCTVIRVNPLLSPPGGLFFSRTF